MKSSLAFIISSNRLKKYILVLIVLSLCVSAFTLESFSVAPTVGYGYLKGSRYYKDNPESYVCLCATGIETGFSLEAQIDSLSGIEGYFGYLFALNGGMSTSTGKNASLEKISSGWKYTDYKAGVGYVFHYKNFRFASGINFAGISNHKFEEKIQTEGNKVTSFGLYLKAGYLVPLYEKLNLITEIHSCLNFAGWIREFDSSSQKWIDHFEKSKIQLESLFCKIGVVYYITTAH